MLKISPHPFNPSSELEQFSKQAVGAGAVVSFSGHVRATSTFGEVSTLHLQAYDPLTRTSITSAMESVKARWPVPYLRVRHRTGDMHPGDAIVFVAAASAHRRAAFEAADFLMDYLKTEAVFWKKEIGRSGAKWIEPRMEDYKDSARWRVAGDKA